MLFTTLSKLNLFFNNLTIIWKISTTNFLLNTIFLKRYYKLNSLVWEEGFLIDFLQKKVVDKWVRKFLITSAYIFNERLVFDYIVLYYSKMILWSGHFFMIFEVNNVASLLFLILLLFISSTLLLFLLFTTLILI